MTHKDAVISGLHSDTLYVKLDSRLTDSLANTGIVTSFQDPGLFVMENGTILVKPALSIMLSEDSLYHMTRNIFSRGRSVPDALKYNRAVRYHYALKDSSLVFDPIAILPEGQAWQSRNVRIRLEVPAGKYVVLDSSVYRILSHEVHDDPWMMAGKTYRMTPGGLEECQAIR